MPLVGVNRADISLLSELQTGGGLNILKRSIVRGKDQRDSCRLGSK
jgi:hypothetical protein